MITLDSRISEVYAHPVGHDILKKVLLQLGRSEKWIDNPLAGSLELRDLQKISGSILDESFYDSFLHLLNNEKDVPVVSQEKSAPAWWKEAVFYQIYPRSFCDSNGDGIGDLQGILSKLDYLKELGIDALWLSPIYDSPDDDNGYDIRDYRKIQEAFGTMEDFDTLLNEVHKRGMKLIMDLVVNHTSDEHRWFQEALKDPQSPYRDYYFLKKGHYIPNNWTSFFSGEAWNRYDDDLWGLHLFSKKQMDLNWDNPNVRKDVIEMINWWLKKGVDGFRMDVINYISKEEGLPEGNASVGELMGYTGIEHYYYGPHLHGYLRQIHEEAFAPHQAFSVGETPGIGMKMSQLLSGEERGELDAVFSFDHLETPGHVRFEDYKYDLKYYRDYVIDYMENYGNNCHFTLFWNNHDNPRMISKITDEAGLHRPLAILLAVLQLTLKGIPFLYQGDEMGLANIPFRSMKDIQDIESINKYNELKMTMSPEEAWKIILAGTRDHTRMPLPWNEIPEGEGYRRQIVDIEVRAAYKLLIALRKKHSVFAYGDFKVLDRSGEHFTYLREDEKERFLIDCNLSDREIKAYQTDGELLFPHTEGNGKIYLRPYEARVYKCNKEETL
ncbi:MAG: alpha-glucosidase [Erysipelotrichaceae bacterium]|nr:alpha-glucosidase [Erysipelotrichaceae bacterium]